MQQCKAILKTGSRCKRRQIGEYCYQHAPKHNIKKKHPLPVPKNLSFVYSFDHKPTAKTIRELHKFLLDVPFKEYQMCWKRGVDKISAKPIRGLQKCNTPDRATFLDKVEKKKGSAGHFLSQTGKSRLVIPLKPYTHLACFVKEGSFQEFKDMIQMIHSLVARSPPGMPLSVYTHGLDVDWLHVKIRPDPFMK